MVGEFRRLDPDRPDGTLPVDQRYTYDFDGISEVLDHILVTRGPANPQYQVVHINSEYADQV